MDADVTGKHARRGGCEEPTSLLLGSDRPACSAPEPESSRCPPLQRGQPCSEHGWRCRQLAELAVSLRDAHHLAPTGARAVPSGASHEREGKRVASLLEGGKLFLFESPSPFCPSPVFLFRFFHGGCDTSTMYTLQRYLLPDIQVQVGMTRNVHLVHCRHLLYLLLLQESPARAQGFKSPVAISDHVGARVAATRVAATRVAAARVTAARVAATRVAATRVERCI